MDEETKNYIDLARNTLVTEIITALNGFIQSNNKRLDKMDNILIQIKLIGEHNQNSIDELIKLVRSLPK